MQKTAISVESNFKNGFVTEYTGLNFPAQAATATANMVYERIGNVHRRPGINYETNHANRSIVRSSSAMSNYKWNNASGDGVSQIEVIQTGSSLQLYQTNTATLTSSVSTHFISSIALSPVSSLDATLECQYSDANGFLFVFHPNCNPFYVTFNSSSIALTASSISVQTRDVQGIPDNSSITVRPTSLSAEHKYNLQNQGWADLIPVFPGWSDVSFSVFNTAVVPNDTVVTVASPSDPAVVGEPLNLQTLGCTVQGTITSVAGSVLGYHFTAASTSGSFPVAGNFWQVSSPGFAPGSSLIDVFHSVSTIAAYPSNTDIWWEFKDVNGVFNPWSTASNIPISTTAAPKGHYVTSAFNIDRTSVSGISSITVQSTNARPSTGCWFQGRIWYSGVNASFQATGDAPYYTWTENIYFSQVIDTTVQTTGANQFGNCYSDNDPTSDKFFDILPTDGGVITIPGAGPIYKLFPIQNGVLVFAGNGIWLVTGTGPAGAFSATSYNVAKISAIQTTSGTSFVDVQGLPYWWNNEAIYRATLTQGNSPYGNGGFNIEPITLTTIQSFYQALPISSKAYVRGTYDPLNWVIRWLYKSTEATSVDDRYNFDMVLCFNVITNAFYTYSLMAGGATLNAPNINGVQWIQNPGGTGTPTPTVKYLVTAWASGTSYNLSFAEEKDRTNWVDFFGTYGVSSVGLPYVSSFTTGYKIQGRGSLKEQIEYLNFYLNNESRMYYKLQGNWDWSINRSSGKWTAFEEHNTAQTDYYSVERKRHKINGRGLAYQFTVQSQPGQPLDIIGWSVEEKVNQGI